MGKHKKKKPEIRFKGFTDDWEQRKLGDYIIEYQEVTTENNQYPPLTSSRKGIFLQKDYFAGNQIASTDNTGYNIVPFGYFTYRHMSDDEIFHFNINDIIENGIVSTLYPVFTTTKGIDSKYLQYQLNHGYEFTRYALSQKQGGSRTYMYLNKLKMLHITIPTAVKEQKAIANCLMKIDNLITLHQRKLNKLKKVKKSMLEKMFPQNGEIEPQIRFCGFNSTWEQRKLGWLVDNDVIEAPKDGNHGEKHPTSDEYVEKGIPFLMASDIHNGRVDLENCKYITKERAKRLDKGFAREGDVLLTHKATIGEVAILEGLQEEYAMLTPQVTYYRILDNKRLSHKYLYAVFHSESFQNEMQTKAAQSTRPYIGISAQQNLTISLPCSTKEQQRIGEYFASLDTFITLHQRKLEKLKKIKKAMLEKMFV